VRAGQPKPDVDTAEAVKQAVMAVGSVAIFGGLGSEYLRGLFGTLGIAEPITGRLKQAPPGVQAGELLARGEADRGFQQVSELLQIQGIQHLGVLGRAARQGAAAAIIRKGGMDTA